MKTTLLLIIGLINSLLSYSQSFEGVIQYKMEYESKNSFLFVEEMKKELGTEVTAYLKKGFYKELSNSTYMSFQLYRQDDKTLYYKHHLEDDTLRVNIYEEKEAEKFEYQIFEKTDTILGVVCNKLVVYDELGVKKYYFSSKYPLNSEFFKNYPDAKNYEIRKLMKAVVLRFELEYEYFKVDLTATSIKRKKLRKKFFSLPEYKFIKKE